MYRLLFANNINTGITNERFEVTVVTDGVPKEYVVSDISKLNIIAATTLQVTTSKDTTAVVVGAVVICSFI